jgi:hypothetical protein
VEVVEGGEGELEQREAQPCRRVVAAEDGRGARARGRSSQRSSCVRPRE